jgi:2-octaprenyl-6-methoxyphenol hydroxylase
MKKYDVIIVGSGPIAIVTSLLLSKSNVKVCLLIDDLKYFKNDFKQHGPARLFAIAQHSYEIFNQIGISKQIVDNSQPINHIRVVDDNSYSKVDFLPQDIDLENFGYLIDELVLLKFLYSKLNENLDKVDVFYASTDIKIESTEFFTHIYCEKFINLPKEKEVLDHIYAPLVIGADGKRSTVRKLVDIDTKEIDYGETAIVIDIKHSEWPHNGVAVEKFTPNGAFAILPKHELLGTMSSLVWIEKGKINKDDINFFDKHTLKDLILRKLNGYLGSIEISSDPLTYNLKLVKAKQRYKNRIVLIGDAAQAIHPIAGQGLNLGLRDVEGIIKMISSGLEIGLDIGSNSLLDDYSSSRALDVQKMITGTTFLTNLFSNNILPVKIIRRIGLRGFDKISWIKKLTMKYASGL